MDTDIICMVTAHSPCLQQFGFFSGMNEMKRQHEKNEEKKDTTKTYIQYIDDVSSDSTH